jgi:hypothetical protein
VANEPETALPALTEDSVLRRSSRAAWQTFESELVVLDMPTRTLLGVNPVGGLVCNRLDGATPLGAIARGIATEYAQPAEQVFRDVQQFAQDLIARGCLELVACSTAC